MRRHYSELKQFFKTHERLVIPGMLIVGLLVDLITFKNIKFSTAFLFLFFYILLAGSIIAFINAYDGGHLHRSKLIRYIRLAASPILQFSFGALLSASLIFYWFSGTFSVSWPILLIFAILMMSNDVLRHHYMKPIVQIGVYYFILFSIGSLVLPYLLNSISGWIFFASGITSLAVVYVYVRALSKHLEHIEIKQKPIAWLIGAIFITMNLLYLLNIIPPIPLSLREAGVYHNVRQFGVDYSVSTEKESIIDKIIPGKTIHIQEGKRVFVLTSIFAPADLNTTIVHHWQYYDEEKRKWISDDKLSFNISGGRESGYRGFSSKAALRQALYRVDVETKRGQVLGRVKFFVKFVDRAVELENSRL